MTVMDQNFTRGTLVHIEPRAILLLLITSFTTMFMTFCGKSNGVMGRFSPKVKY